MLEIQAALALKAHRLPCRGNRPILVPSLPLQARFQYNGQMTPAVQAGAFPATRWSMIVAAGRSTSPESRRALETLCETYWPPIYAFIRRVGHDRQDASDLTQAFFARLLAGSLLAAADSARGRFRSYLLGALKHFLADERDRVSARKRGAGHEFVPFNPGLGEETYAWELVDAATPDLLFERRWALALMARGLERLEEECSLAGKASLFVSLKGFLTEGAGTTSTYPEAAAVLGMTEANVRMTVTRLRRRYAELIRAEVAQTLDSDQAVEEEMRYLLQVLRA